MPVTCTILLLCGLVLKNLDPLKVRREIASLILELLSGIIWLTFEQIRIALLPRFLNPVLL